MLLCSVLKDTRVTNARSREHNVPIYELLKKRKVFSPEDVEALSNVFEDTLQTLGVVDRKSPITTLVAHKIIELAQTGERDPTRLKQLILDGFKQL